MQKKNLHAYISVSIKPSAADIVKRLDRKLTHNVHRHLLKMFNGSNTTHITVWASPTLTF